MHAQRNSTFSWLSRAHRNALAAAAFALAVVAGVAHAQALAPPSGLTIVRNGSSLQLAWRAVDGATGYEIACDGDATVLGSPGPFRSSDTSIVLEAPRDESAYSCEVRGTREETPGPPSRRASSVAYALTELGYWGAMTVGDFNNDGMPELLGTLAGANGLAPVSEASLGLASLRSPGRVYRDVRIADLDGDGLPDIVANVYSSPLLTESFCRLYWGQPGGGFLEDAAFAEKGIRGYGETILVADFNNDGHPDIFLPFYTDAAAQSETNQNFLLMNGGDRTFTDRADAMGVANRLWPEFLRVEGAHAVDFDGDGWIDIYTGSHLYRNNGGMGFTDVRETLGLPLMFDEGAQFTDWNRDGKLDLVLNPIEPELVPRLYEYDGTRFVQRTGIFRSVPDRRWKFGLSVADFNADGLEDLIVPGGYDADNLPAHPIMMINRGEWFEPTDFAPPEYRNAETAIEDGILLASDVTKDGLADLFIAKDTIAYLEARMPVTPFVRVEVVDAQGRRNQFGRVVTVSGADPAFGAMARAVDGGSGYMAQSEYVVTFATPGLTEAIVAVRFASRVVTVNVPVGSTVTVFEDGRSVISGRQVIAFDPAPVVTVAGTAALGASGGPSGKPVVFTSVTPAVCGVSGGQVTGISKGLCTIAANQKGNGAYNAAIEARLSFPVEKKSQAIAFDPLPDRLLGELAAVSATASSNLPVSFASSTPDICSVAGATVSLLKTGTCTVAANQAGNAEFDAAPEVLRSFLVLATPDTVITSGPPSLSNAASASFAFAVPAGSEPGVYAFECSLDGGAFVACTSPTAYSGLANGAHTFAVRARNAAGIADPTPASRSWTIDTVAPLLEITLKPAITEANQAAYSIAGNCSEAGRVVAVGIGTLVSAALCGSAQSGRFTTAVIDVSSLPDGQVTLRASISDLAGNATTLFDATTKSVKLPSPTILAPTAGGILTPVTSFSGTSVGMGSSVTVFEGPTALCVATANASRNWSCQASLALGDHAVFAVESVAGIPTSSAAVPFVVRDLTVVTLVSSANPSLVGQATTFTTVLPGSPSPSGTVQFRDGSQPIAGCEQLTLAASQASCTTTALSSGGHAITVAYTGDERYAPAVSNALGLWVLAANPRLGNVSTRGQVGTGDQVMIAGFIVSGTAPKRVLVRARGPSLASFGVTGALADPLVNVYAGQALVASNDNWVTAANSAEVQASGFQPDHPLESAVLATLAPGAYTAIVSGVGGATGVAIVEVFELDPAEAPLANISTRGLAINGDKVLIGGFIIRGDAPQTVVVRARGPSLAPFGVKNVLANPLLKLYSTQALIAANDDWTVSPDASAIQAMGMAPALAAESALLVTLNPGAYTAIVSGADGGAGVAIVEVFAR